MNLEEGILASNGEIEVVDFKYFCAVSEIELHSLCTLQWFLYQDLSVMSTSRAIPSFVDDITEHECFVDVHFLLRVD